MCQSPRSPGRLATLNPDRRMTWWFVGRGWRPAKTARRTPPGADVARWESSVNPSTRVSGCLIASQPRFLDFPGHVLTSCNHTRPSLNTRLTPKSWPNHTPSGDPGSFGPDTNRGGSDSGTTHFSASALYRQLD